MVLMEVLVVAQRLYPRLHEHTECLTLKEVKERIPRNTVTTMWVLEPNLGPQQKQQELLIAEPPL